MAKNKFSLLFHVLIGGVIPFSAVAIACRGVQVDTANAIQDVYKAIDLCLNNKFFEAEGLVKPW